MAIAIVMVRKCIYCNNGIPESRGGRAKYCGKECYKKSQRSRNNKLLKSLKCEICSNEFTQTYTSQRICSDACRKIYKAQWRMDNKDKDNYSKSYSYWKKHPDGLRDNISDRYLESVPSGNYSMTGRGNWKLNAVQAYVYWLFNLASRECVIEHLSADPIVMALYIKYIKDISIKEIINTAKCVGCGCDLTKHKRRSNMKYCSLECYHKNVVGVSDNCEYCGKAYNKKRIDGKFCSKECYVKSGIDTYRSNVLSSKNDCLECNKKLPLYRSKYCSDECLKKWTNRRVSDLRKIDANCVECGNKLKRCDIGRRKRKYCSYICKNNAVNRKRRSA